MATGKRRRGFDARPDRRAVLAGAGAAVLGLAAPVRAAPPPIGGALVMQARRAGLTGRVGYIAVDAATGAVLDALEPDMPLAPASVAKAPTAVFALHALGAGAQFRTEALATGPIRGGRLEGDLVLRGGGDPTLDSDGLAALAAEVCATVRSVSGAFRVDPGATPAAAAIDPAMREAAAYNPAVGGLNLNFNRVLLEWRRGGGGLEARLAAHAVGWSPEAPTVALDLAPPDCGCPTFSHAAAGPGEVWRVRSAALNGEGSVWLPVREPSAYAAGVFRAAAAARGLSLPPPVFGAPAAGERARTLASHGSGDVRSLCADMLRYSTNLTAEALGLAASRAIGAAPADLAASGAAMAAWFAGYAGIPPGDPGFRFANHSGLSADSRVSPRRMAQALAAALRAPAPGAPLPELLREHPIDDSRSAAPAGTLVRAKTGTLDFARGLGGYLATPGGRAVVFAYAANDLDRRRPGEDRPDGAIPWRNRAVALERALLRDWAARFDG